MYIKTFKRLKEDKTISQIEKDGTFGIFSHGKGQVAAKIMAATEKTKCKIEKIALEFSFLFEISIFIVTIGQELFD